MSKKLSVGYYIGLLVVGFFFEALFVKMFLTDFAYRSTGHFIKAGLAVVVTLVVNVVNGVSLYKVVKRKRS